MLWTLAFKLADSFFDNFGGRRVFFSFVCGRLVFFKLLGWVHSFCSAYVGCPRVCFRLFLRQQSFCSAYFGFRRVCSAYLGSRRVYLLLWYGSRRVFFLVGFGFRRFVFTLFWISQSFCQLILVSHSFCSANEMLGILD